ncbi:MAG: (d)CMP kinase [Clostridia bacterium]|nr:(d)CMP kinase [Clostridia bacterium]
MNKFINIAIDGPSGAGKSTISKIIAKKLGFVYIDTGAMYRMVGLYAFEKGIKLEECEKVVPYLNEIQLDIRFFEEGQKFYLNGKDVTTDIRQNEISMYASKTSAVKEVRQFLFDMQRKFAKENNCIMDGRDIGTVILPWADIKIFLTASVEDRAERRYKELIEKGQDVTFEQILEDVKKRDYNDTHRDIAPLKPADDAIIVDTTGNTFEKSIQVLENVIRENMK